MRKILKTVFILFLTLTTQVCPFLDNLNLHAQSKDSIILAGGCFWCVEADFEKVKGVSEALQHTSAAQVNLEAILTHQCK